MWDSVFLFLVEAGARCACLSAGLNVLKLKVLNHRVCRGLCLEGSRRQYLFQKVEVLHLFLAGELDVELDVEVAEVVVTVGWHALSLDNFDLAYREGSVSKGAHSTRRKIAETTYQE
jgi:hypothetical protein